MGDYFRPEYLSDALELLSARKLTILAGGTDYYPTKVGELLDDPILDITGIKSLSGIEKTVDGWRIGPTTTWSEIFETDLPPQFDGLKAAAAEVGGYQIQNSGTIAGNICNASPAADGVPALLSLCAEVELSHELGVDRISLKDFILGNRRTKLQSYEILTNIFIPSTHPLRSKSSFLKLGSRRYLVISTVMVAGLVEWDEQFRISKCKITVGACSEVALPLSELESNLIGVDLSENLENKLEASHFAELSPLNDVRATADYRVTSAFTLVKRMLKDWSISGE